ncbi:MAG TPA: DUF1570 domain-containing protein [Candidatus Omnitrophota bacterium]|nr:DUF1570 domain-containing protein [Candidatus Omnitrophota bacterium]HQO57633.1 DUF1570 domain-containing protein [Candidatus Omnitrophota bacterium]HQP12676.1 DUF1570 domain-containing protein [Candidatus Omnitrophota bacterium]
MKRHGLIAGIVWTALLGQPAPAAGDTFYLRSGKIVEGTIVEETDDALKIKTDRRIFSLQKRLIQKIETETPVVTKVGTRAPYPSRAPQPGSPGRPFTPVDVEILSEGYTLSPEVREEIVYVISKMFIVFEDVFGLDFNRERMFKTRVFGDFGAYQSYRGQESASRSDAGFYSLENKEMVLWKNENERNMLRVLYNEASRAILRRQISRCPPWIEEGLAEFFEYGTLEADSVVVRPQTQKDQRMKKWLQTGALMPLEDFLRLTDEQWRQRNEQANAPMSTISWSLVIFLLSTEKGRAAFAGLIRELRRFHHKNFPGHRAIERYYPGGLRQLEAEWHTWIPQSRIEYNF